MLDNKVYFHILMPLIGLFQLTKKTFYISKYTLPLAALGGYSLLHSLVLKEYYSMMRSIQLIGIFGFFGYCLKSLTKEDFLSISKKIILLSILYIPIEFFFSSNIRYFWRNIGVISIHFVRLHGFLGNSSFTGALLSGLMLIFLHSKQRVYFLTCILLIYLTASRGAMLVVFLTPIFYYLAKLRPLKSILLVFSSILIIASPFSTVVLRGLLNNESIEYLDFLSTSRLFINQIYLDKFKRNKLGFGYRSQARLKISDEEIMHFKSKLSDRGIIDFSLKDNKTVDYLQYIRTWKRNGYEEHNIFLETLIVLGIPGYALLSIFFAIVVFNTLSYFVILSFMPFLFINGLHEFIFYFSLAYFIKYR